MFKVPPYFKAAFALFAFAILLLAASPLAADGELGRALQSREKFMAEAEKKQLRTNWLTLIKEFEEAAQAQVEPRYAAKARYLGAELALTAGRRFKQNSDFEKAEALARRAVRDCPGCSTAANAQLISGQALMVLKKLDQAEKQLMKVELNYPASPEVAEARRLLAQIRGGSTPIPEGPKTATVNATAKGSTPSAQNQQPRAEDQKDQPNPKSAPGPKAPPAPKKRGDGLAQIYFISLVDSGTHNTVTAYLDQVTPYVYNLIPPAKSGGTFRVYADIKGAVIAPGTKLQLSDKTQLIKLVKMNQYKEEVVRLVVDMPEAHHYRPTFLNNPPRLIFHVAKEAGRLPEPGSEAQPDPPEKTAEAVKPKAQPKPPPPPKPGASGPADSMARQLGLKVKTIVIDPGHGGKDGGAQKYGLKEKDVVLKLAKKLESRIKKKLGLEVHLTRTEDKFITLERRTKTAREKKADLFISLHVNANDLAAVEGFETYVLNFATDRSAMAVAARENASSDKSVAQLEDILRIIAKNTKVAESRTLAQAMHKSALATLNTKYKVRDLGVKEAPFFVLVGADVPAILVEVGFLTNEKEAGRLNQDAYLDLVADGLVKGLESYIKAFR